MVDFKELSLNSEAVVKTVEKFKEYGIGVVLTNYISEKDNDKHTRWHDLVYGKIVGMDLVSAMKERFKFYRRQAIEEQSLDGLMSERPSILLNLTDETGERIGITYEELAIFTWAAYTKRIQVESFRNEKVELETLKATRNKHKTPQELRDDLDARIAELEKKHSK